MNPLVAILAVVATPLTANGLPAPPAAAARQAEAADAVSDETIARWVRELGNDEFLIREQAQKRLAGVGFRASDALSAAAQSGDLEVASRARALLATMAVPWVMAGDPPGVQQILKDYDVRPSDIRLIKIRQLAALRSGQGWQALCRVVRFEKSILLAKYAALAILEREPADEVRRHRLADTIDASLRNASRLPAQWLLDYAALADRPAEALTAWRAHIDIEQQLFARGSSQTSPQIVIALVYQLAIAEALAGQPEAAEKTAERALQVFSGDQPAMLLFHFETANTLRRRGLFAWAEAEYRHVLRFNLPEVDLMVYLAVAEMRHDQGNNLGAAEAMESLMVSRQNARGPGTAGRSRGGLLARRDYFLACHWRAEGDLVRHRRYLESATQADPAEIDVLIARHAMPDAEPAFRARTAELVAAAAAELRDAVRQVPDEPEGLNQLAWLLGNAGGDLDEALQLSRRAVTLEPDNGAFLDTLAHVYAARGDYENAVRHQAQAVELEPHSGLIAKKLAVFRQLLSDRGQQGNEGANKPAGP